MKLGSNIFDCMLRSQIYLIGSGMAGNDNGDSGDSFARAFGKALRNFLDSTGMTQVETVKLLGLKDKKSGKPSKSRLNTYLTDSPPMPDAQVLYLACTKLKGFNFEHNGHRMNFQAIRRKGQPLGEKPPEQMVFGFNRQFNLTDKKGAVTEKGAFAVRMKRPSGRIELSISLKEDRSS
jgi:transcriptional regulator with XRE-family HTH domain